MIVRRFLLGVVIVGVMLLIVRSDESELVDSARGTDGSPRIVDPAKGRVGSVTLGSSVERVTDNFGPGSEITGPSEDRERLGSPGWRTPEKCDRPDRRPLTRPPEDGDAMHAVGLRETAYEDGGAAFCDRRAFQLITTSRGSRTAAGASVGMPLDEARRRHHGLHCAYALSAAVTPERAFRYCTGRVGTDRWLYLGQDPVSTIAVASVPMD